MHLSIGMVILNVSTSETINALLLFLWYKMLLKKQSNFNSNYIKLNETVNWIRE